MRNVAAILLGCVVSATPSFGEALPAASGRESVYTLAVIPSAPPVTMHTQWTPFVEHLSAQTGFGFRLKLYQEMAEFERDIWRGAPDFIFSSPIQITVAHTSNGYIPLIRGGGMVRVALFVRKDSPIKNIDDLAGRKITFVGNKNLCSVAIRHLLEEHKNKLAFATEYAGSTRNVILTVLLGKSDAGAVFLPELARESEETRNQLREIVVTPEIAPHPLSAHPRVSRAVREAVTKASLAMAATREGAELLKTLRLGAPVPADYERDYRPLEEIDVRRLTDWGH